MRFAKKGPGRYPAAPRSAPQAGAPPPTPPTTPPTAGRPGDAVERIARYRCPTR